MKIILQKILFDIKTALEVHFRSIEIHLRKVARVLFFKFNDLKINQFENSIISHAHCFDPDCLFII